MRRAVVCCIACIGVITVATFAGIGLTGAPGVAHAQAAPKLVAQPGPPPLRLAQVQAAPVPAPEEMGPNPTPSTGKALCFWIFAALAVGGGIATITRRNLVTAVMFLVGTFLALAGLFALLYAHFLAVIQVLVYAGAIMVLFVFVVMILNKEEEEPWALRGLVGKAIAGGTLAYLLYRIVTVLYNAPKEIPEPPQMAQSFGTTASIARTLFSTYLFPFEAVSLVLLIAVVGALVLAHPGHANASQTASQATDGDPAEGERKPS